jgi:hypothetical protein
MDRARGFLGFSLLPEIYPVSIHVVYSDDEERIGKFFSKAVGEDELVRQPCDITVRPDALVSSYGEHILMEFRPDEKRGGAALAALVAHEAVHASWRLERIVGDCFDMNIQEPQCYFVQYLVGEITNRIWEHLEKRKKNGKRNKR